ncbi:MAG: hypothetical protein JNK14_15120 [Chitinophagaceae bacterium]|nr:hypothetical protein [Chitinophagaceae bacterium]
MKKTVFILTGCLFSVFAALAQNKQVPEQKGYRHTVAASIQVPIGTFAASHIAGIGSQYSWSRYRFGHLTAKPSKAIGFTADGGIDYYLGKKITEAGYSFRFGNYLYLHSFAGIMYNPGKVSKQNEYLNMINLRLTAGPTLGLYKRNADVGYGVRLCGSYYLMEKIAITPGMMFRKHALASTLWSAILHVSYNF